MIIPLVSGRKKTHRHSTAQEDVDAQTGVGRGIMGNIFFVAKHFGTGIILSTAFIVSRKLVDPPRLIARVELKNPLSS